jgi:hypothetical protein
MVVVVFGSKNNNMKNHWRQLISALPQAVERYFYKRFFEKEHEQLQQQNVEGPASNYTKHHHLRTLAEKYSIDILVETGTYLGDTLYSLYPSFAKLYSIELSEHFFALAQKRFKQYNKIQLLQGDSGEELHKLVPQFNQPALFWLDGHYSGGITAKGKLECPVYEELNAIFASPFNHVIVIDDARLFVGKNDYPTIEELKIYLAGARPTYSFSVSNDAIVMAPLVGNN